MRDQHIVIKQDRKMKDVWRFSGTSILKPCNIATHGGLAALIFADLCEAIGVIPSAKQITWIIRHDIPETITGDLLWPAKQHLGDLWDEVEVKSIENACPQLHAYAEVNGKELFDELTWSLFRLSDYLEGWHQCQEEKSVGNYSDAIIDASRNYAGVIKRTVEQICYKQIEEYVHEYMVIFTE